MPNLVARVLINELEQNKSTKKTCAFLFQKVKKEKDEEKNPILLTFSFSVFCGCHVECSTILIKTK